MALKKAAPEYQEKATMLSDDPWTHQGTPKPLIRIHGLRQLESGLFELDAPVIPREIDWPMVALGLGFKGGPFPESLADRIAGEVFREDVMAALRERITL